MINLMKQSGHETYNLKQYVLDTEADLADLPVRNIAVGSAALVIETSNVYMLNSKGKWIEIAGGGGGTGGSAVLTEAITSQVAIGSVSVGTYYPVGTSLETIIHDMLTKEENPVVTITIAPADTLYDAVEGKVESLKITAKVTKKSYDIDNVTMYFGNTVIKLFNQDVAEGGTFEFTYVPDEPIKKTFTIKATADDVEGGRGTNSIVVTFIGKTYYGLIDPDATEVTEDMIKELNPILKKSKSYIYGPIICDYNKVVYAYPKELGALSSIKDMDNNINYTNSFERTELTVDDIDYYCYTLKEATGAREPGANLTFA